MTSVPTSLRLAALALAAAAPLLAAPAAQAQRAGGGAFSDLQGSWTGTGTVTSSAGTERIRCRGAYAVGGDGNTVRANLRCASDSYKIDLRADLRAQGSALSGNWSESTRGVGGAVSGSAGPGRFSANVGGAGFQASISANTSGNRQSVSIRSSGGEVSAVQISLAR